MKFYNREKERNQITDLLTKIDAGHQIAICVEGSSGVGKSFLLKYVMKTYGNYAFLYNGTNLVYKCLKSNADKEFLYISTVLATLQLKNAELFNRCVVNYFDTINATSVREGLALLIPEIPGFDFTSKILSNSLEKIIEPKSYIENALLKPHLIKCFAEIVKSFIKGQQVILCIDDIVWIDSMSLEVLKLLVNGKDNSHISLFLTTRRYTDFETMIEQAKYQDVLADLIEDNYSEENKAIIVLHNFDYKLLKKIIQEENNSLILQNLDLFYEITNGNPLEIYNTQKFSNYELENVFDKCKKNISCEANPQALTTELNLSVLTSNYYNASILISLALLDTEVNYNLLSIISREIYQKYYNLNFEENEFQIQIENLVANGILKGNDTITAVHDSTIEIVIAYIKNSGEYVEFVDIVSTILFEIKGSSISFVTIVLRLLSETDQKKGFAYFKKICKSSTPNIEILKYAAKCFGGGQDNWTIVNIEQYGINIFFREFLLNGALEEASVLGKLLYKVITKCSKEEQYKFLIMYLKVLIDLGKFSDEDSESANMVFQALCNLEKKNANQKLEIYLMAMTLYEHQGIFEKISEYYIKSERLINNIPDISATLKATFYRNKGLVYFHADLENDYRLAISESKLIQDTNAKNLMLGTSYNNLGLSKFYQGNIIEAKKYFEKAINYIEQTGYETIRTLNNQACCAFVLHQYEYALYFFKKALQVPFKGEFEVASVKLNLSLVLYMLDDSKSAMTILDDFINEYISGKPRDGWIYSNAYLNRGYIKYSEGKYLEACEDYKKSNFYKSRFQEEQEYLRREALMKKCLIKGGFLNDDISYGIGNNESKFDFYKTPYILSLLAYYVI